MTKCPVCDKTQLVFVAGPIETGCYYCGAHWVQEGSEQQAKPALPADVARVQPRARERPEPDNPQEADMQIQKPATVGVPEPRTRASAHDRGSIADRRDRTVPEAPGFFDYPFELAALAQAQWAVEFKAAYEAIQVGRKGEDDDKQQVADTIKQAVRRPTLDARRCKITRTMTRTGTAKWCARLGVAPPPSRGVEGHPRF